MASGVVASRVGPLLYQFDFLPLFANMESKLGSSFLFIWIMIPLEITQLIWRFYHGFIDMFALFILKGKTTEI